MNRNLVFLKKQKQSKARNEVGGLRGCKGINNFSPTNRQESKSDFLLALNKKEITLRPM